MTRPLFSPFTLGDLELNNRMIMAPMTRNRAGEGNAPTDMNATYYQQRASAGLIISEATQVSEEGIGYPGTPGIHSKAQVNGWKKVTDAVHAKGGKMFAQLWFCGRISHPSLLGGNTPVAPSAIRPEGEAMTMEGMQAFVTPHALEQDEIATIITQYRHAAEQAKLAGFDGIEVHAANGYLIDQFLRDGSNQREDEYGGSVKNRMRFLHEVMDAVSQVWPTQRIGVRLTPENSFNSMSDSDPQNHFDYFISLLNQRELAYIHILQGDMMTKQKTLDYVSFRDAFDGAVIVNNGYDLEHAEKALESNEADLVAFGVPFLANPDLVKRYQTGAALNEPDQSTFYGGDEKGYTDYPSLDNTHSQPAA
jgi:N-ethylmaleimide reductase